MTSELAKELNKGGFTVRDGNLIRPTSGYAVSIKGWETRVPRALLSLPLFTAIVKSYQGLTFGAWIDDGIVYFDRSFIYADRQAAIDVGHANGQKAIYDFAAGESIYLEEVKEVN
jgi:hypothetical protein